MHDRRPQEGPDHLRRRQRLPPRGRGGPGHAPGGRRVRRRRRARTTTWGEKVVAYVVLRPGRRRWTPTAARGALPGLAGRLQGAPRAGRERPRCPATRPARCSSASCATRLHRGRRSVMLDPPQINMIYERASTGAPIREGGPVRPHVELIQEDDYVWHAAELPGGEGRASERRLSVDEEDGSSSLRVDFHTDWGRGPGIHHANTEYYVLEGEIDYGGQKIGKGGYVYAPKGVPIDYLKVAEGTRILHYREYGDAGLRPGRLAGRRHALGRRPRGRHRHRLRRDDSGTPSPTPARCPACSSSTSTSTRSPASTPASCTRRRAGRTTGWPTTPATRRRTRPRATWSTTSAPSTSAPTSSARPG